MKYPQFIHLQNIPKHFEAVKSPVFEDYGREFFLFYCRKIKQYLVYQRPSHRATIELKEFYNSGDVLRQCAVCMFVVPELSESLYFKCKRLQGVSHGVKSTKQILEEFEEQIQQDNARVELEKLAREIEHEVQSEYEKYFIRGRTSLSLGLKSNKLHKRLRPEKIVFVGLKTGKPLGEVTKDGKIIQYEPER